MLPEKGVYEKSRGQITTKEHFEKADQDQLLSLGHVLQALLRLKAP